MPRQWIENFFLRIQIWLIILPFQKLNEGFTCIQVRKLNFKKCCGISLNPDNKYIYQTILKTAGRFSVLSSYFTWGLNVFGILRYVRLLVLGCPEFTSSWSRRVWLPSSLLPHPKLTDLFWCYSLRYLWVFRAFGYPWSACTTLRILTNCQLCKDSSPDFIFYL